jgi:carbonic anhydrase
VEKNQPGFFKKLAVKQNPDYLWIGCSDSRVPANTVTGLQPGEMFVHRNIANQVIHSDLNCISVLQFAVEVLKVKHIIVCGHYDCGGVKAARDNNLHGLIDHWLYSVRDLDRRHAKEINLIKAEKEKVNRLCELNVRKQVFNVAHSTIVQTAWSNGRNLTVHGWIYDLKNGLLNDLDLSIFSNREIP